LSDHYYSTRPNSKQDERTVTAELCGEKLSFRTNAGVFSKKGIDFGSRLLIETVVLKEKEHILDLGCGYGPIGIALAKANPTITVQMVDINERAVALVEENARRNDVAQQVRVKSSDGFDAISGELFDMILCNPPIRMGKALIYQLFEQAKKHLHPSGSLWIVIRKQQGAASAKQELANFYGSVEQVAQKKGYCIFLAKNN
jgi:16S rRNA (guanine1207-N2)-methyltransferase